jgi:hypothetical protein
MPPISADIGGLSGSGWVVLMLVGWAGDTIWLVCRSGSWAVGGSSSLGRGRGWWASFLRLALVVVLVPVIVVLDVGAADAVKVPETMSKRRAVGSGVRA